MAPPMSSTFNELTSLAQASMRSKTDYKDHFLQEMGPTQVKLCFPISCSTYAKPSIDIGIAGMAPINLEPQVSSAQAEFYQLTLKLQVHWPKSTPFFFQSQTAARRTAVESWCRKSDCWQ